MELNIFVKLYQDFLKESKQKGWMIEVLIEEFGNYLTLHLYRKLSTPASNSGRV
jgi:hypothetical protein